MVGISSIVSSPIGWFRRDLGGGGGGLRVLLVWKPYIALIS